MFTLCVQKSQLNGQRNLRNAYKYHLLTRCPILIDERRMVIPTPTSEYLLRSETNPEVLNCIRKNVPSKTWKMKNIHIHSNETRDMVGLFNQSFKIHLLLYNKGKFPEHRALLSMLREQPLQAKDRLRCSYRNATFTALNDALG